MPHDGQLHKLAGCGIANSRHTWLSCFLGERSMQVVMEGTTSDSTTADSGVPKGTMLGPLLFLYHINNPPEAVKSQVCLFTDDYLIYREINDFSDHIIL